MQITKPRLESCIQKGYKPLWDARSPEQAMAAVDHFRVLCAHNRGHGGTLQINHLCEKIYDPRKKMV